MEGSGSYNSRVACCIRDALPRQVVVPMAGIRWNAVSSFRTQNQGLSPGLAFAMAPCGTRPMKPGPTGPQVLVELLARARSGCEQSRQGLAERLNDEVRTMVTGSMGGWLYQVVQPKDVTQLVLLSLFQPLPSGDFPTDASLLAYLRQVVLHRLGGLGEHFQRGLRDRRRERPLLDLDTELWDEEQDPARVIQHLDLRRLIRREVERLSPDLRACVKLVYGAGMRPAEASRSLGMPDSSFRKLLARALALLASRLADHAPGND